LAAEIVATELDGQLDNMSTKQSQKESRLSMGRSGKSAVGMVRLPTSICTEARIGSYTLVHPWRCSSGSSDDFRMRPSSDTHWGRTSYVYPGSACATPRRRGAAPGVLSRTSSDAASIRCGRWSSVLQFQSDHECLCWHWRDCRYRLRVGLAELTDMCQRHWNLTFIIPMSVLLMKECVTSTELSLAGRSVPPASCDSRPAPPLRRVVIGQESARVACRGLPIGCRIAQVTERSAESTEIKHPYDLKKLMWLALEKQSESRQVLLSHGCSASDTLITWVKATLRHGFCWTTFDHHAFLQEMWHSVDSAHPRILLQRLDSVIISWIPAVFNKLWKKSYGLLYRGSPDEWAFTHNCWDYQKVSFLVDVWSVNGIRVMIGKQMNHNKVFFSHWRIHTLFLLVNFKGNLTINIRRCSDATPVHWSIQTAMQSTILTPTDLGLHPGAMRMARGSTERQFSQKNPISQWKNSRSSIELIKMLIQCFFLRWSQVMNGIRGCAS
jgi:hypothetical protein